MHRNEGLHQSGLAAGHGHASTLQHEPQPPVTQETTSRLAPPRRLLRILPRPEFCLRCCELPSTTRPISLAASKRFIHCIRVLVLQPPSQEHRRAQFTARPFSPPRRPHAVQPSIATAVHIPYSTLARPRPQSLRIAPPSAIAIAIAIANAPKPAYRQRPAWLRFTASHPPSRCRHRPQQLHTPLREEPLEPRPSPSPSPPSRHAPDLGTKPSRIPCCRRRRSTLA